MNLFEDDARAARGMGSHHSAEMKADEWLTPRYIVDALGPFDLDPCAPVTRPWPTAKRHYTIHDNGLAQPWQGRVWLNPPYSRHAVKWLQRIAQHGNGIALIFARTETEMFYPWVWDHGAAFLFLKGRLHFHFSDGRRAEANAGAPSMLIAYGQRNADILEGCNLEGKFFRNYLRLNTAVNIS